MHLRTVSTIVAMALTSAAYGHHSFAVHYDAKNIITVEGVAKSFRFTNPHGIIELEAKDENGRIQNWTIETTAPVYMQRRGWSKNSIKPGDKLVVVGYAAKDGSHLMRVRQVRLPDGTVLGQSNPDTSTGE
jgi:hypothetical protein